MPTVVLRAEADTTLAEDAPGTPHGSAPTLRVESKAFILPANKRVLVAFDLARLPAGAAQVVHAELRLTPSAKAPGRALRCHEALGPWTEQGATWTSQPPVGADEGTVPSDLAVHAWDVTASVQARIPAGRVGLRVKDEQEGALLGQVQEYPSREAGAGPELVVTYEAPGAASLRSAVEPVRVGAGTWPSALAVRRQGAVWFPSSGHLSGHLGGLAGLPGALRPGRIPGLGALAGIVRLRLAGHAALAAAVRPRLQAGRALASTARPRFAGLAALASSVRPRLAGAGTLLAKAHPRLRGGRGLPSTVEAGLPALPGHARLHGSVAVPLRGPARDLAAISEEAGSLVTHASRGRVRTLRRVVQLIDTRETQTFPRAVASEPGRRSGQDVLRRGDALLWALGGDTFRPGDTVEWQGRAWAVVGTLGVEMVGDVPVYQEVGLRRLALATLGRLQGRVQEGAD